MTQLMPSHTDSSVLIVDDEPNMRRTLADILADEGYRTSTAAGRSLGGLLTLTNVRALNSSSGLLLLIWLGMLIMLLVYPAL